MPVVERFTEFLAAERNASPETVRAYRREVERLLRFLREDGRMGTAEPVDWPKVTAADLRVPRCPSSRLPAETVGAVPLPAGT
ncbi:MAG: site-specific integrase, partial [Candidatus Deferrimicrobium sp.]